MKKLAGFGAIVTAAPTATIAQTTPSRTVRERLWIWAHDAHAYDNAWGLPKNGRMTPVEGAHYMGVPNIIMIRYEGKPAPPFDQYAVPFRSLKQVNWSITGAGGDTSEEERKEVLRLAGLMPNLTGVFMDDFFKSTDDSGKLDKGNGEAPAVLSLAQLLKVRDALNEGSRRLDLGVTLYTYQLHPQIVPHLELCDVISLWTWHRDDLKNIEQNFAKLVQMLPGKRIRLGCYMWSFGDAKPMQLEDMQKQTKLALEWLKAGRIEGIIFLATNICDLGLEAVEWTRDWIARVGDQPIF